MTGMKDLFGDQPVEFGTPPHKLVRKNDPATSKAAAHKVDSKGLEKMVCEAIIGYGAAGCIANDLLARFKELPYSSITARFKALADKQLIMRGPDKRDNQMVMRGAKFVTGAPK